MIHWKRRTESCRSFTLEGVSRLDEDTTTALTTIREWRNSFASINRIPLDVLSLIPTHLPSHSDRFRASFVCRHWRRVFLHHAGLWSELFVSRGEDYVKTLLERAKGSALDVFINDYASSCAMLPLLTRTQQIRRLEFSSDEWKIFEECSKIISGPLPLLHTLKIKIFKELMLHFDNSLPPSQPLFGDAVNLKVLRLHSRSAWAPSLTSFTFPTLVSFDFLVTPSDKFRTSRLLNFLEASPMLRTVHMEIIATISLEDIPPGRIVVLPNVESFKLTTSDGRFGYEIAVYISCPSTTFTSLTLKKDPEHVVLEELFPSQALWGAIVCQYTRNPAEEVTVETKVSDVITSKLAFRSSDGTVLELRFEIADEDEDEDLIYAPSEEALAQATRAIQNHPQLANIRCLHICNYFEVVVATWPSVIANGMARLFKSVGPLDELTVCLVGLPRPFHSFLTLKNEGPVVFPPTKEFTISNLHYESNRECAAIVGLAKSQHALGIPFERVVFCGERMSEEMEERLSPWVESVEHRYEKPHEHI